MPEKENAPPTTPTVTGVIANMRPHPGLESFAFPAKPKGYHPVLESFSFPAKPKETRERSYTSPQLGGCPQTPEDNPRDRGLSDPSTPGLTHTTVGGFKFPMPPRGGGKAKEQEGDSPYGSSEPFETSIPEFKDKNPYRSSIRELHQWPFPSEGRFSMSSPRSPFEDKSGFSPIPLRPMSPTPLGSPGRSAMRSPAPSGFFPMRASGDFDRHTVVDVTPKKGPNPNTSLGQIGSRPQVKRVMAIAPLRMFGLIVSWLPPLGTAPSAQNPLVSPVPLTIGIDFDMKMNTNVYLIYARRTNEFQPQLGQVFRQLNAEEWLLTPCPSAPSNRINGESHLFFLALPVGKSPPFMVEILGKLEAEGVVRRTGVVVETAQEYEVMIPVVSLSKKCYACGRWESLVKAEATSPDNLKYRRWYKCGGCPWAYFCRKECQVYAHAGGHYKLCGGGC